MQSFPLLDEPEIETLWSTEEYQLPVGKRYDAVYLSLEIIYLNDFYLDVQSTFLALLCLKFQRRVNTLYYLQQPR